MCTMIFGGFTEKAKFLRKLLTLLLVSGAVSGSNASKAASNSVTGPVLASSVRTIAELLKLDTSSIDAHSVVAVRGYRVESDGGGGLFIWEPASEEASDSGVVFQGVNGTGRWLRFDTRDINVVQFGADPNGQVDSAHAIVAAIQFAEKKSIPVNFVPGRYLVGKGSSFTFNPMKTSLIGGQAELDWSDPPRSGAAILVASDNTGTYFNRYMQNKTAISGLRIVGGGPGHLLDGDAIKVGDGKAEVTHLKFESIAVQGFATMVEFSNNTYFIEFENSYFQWGQILSPSSPRNFGENMSFRQCWIADGATIQLHNGDWHFYGGSIDNSSLVLDGDAFASIVGGHFENPNGKIPDATFINVRSPNARAFVSDSEFFLSPNLKLNPGLLRGVVGPKGATIRISTSRIYAQGQNSSLMDSQLYQKYLAQPAQGVEWSNVIEAR